MACLECDPDYHEQWCHIDMDCCGCTCRDAYTEYRHQQRHEEEVQRGPTV